MQNYFIIFTLISFLIPLLIYFRVISFTNLPAPISKFLMIFFLNKRFGNLIWDLPIEQLFVVIRSTNFKYFYLLWIIEISCWSTILIYTLASISGVQLYQAIRQSKEVKRKEKIVRSSGSLYQDGIISKQYFWFQKKRLDNLSKLFTWQNRVKTVRMLFRPIILIARIAYGKMNIQLVKSIAVFLFRIFKLINKNGMGYAAKYLKAVHILVMKYIGSKNRKELNSCLFSPKVSLSHGKLPRIIPSYLRLLLREENPNAIRLVLTICNLYRILPFPGKVDLSTITKPSKFVIDDAMENYIPKFLNLLGCYKNPYKFSFIPRTFHSSGSVVSVTETIDWSLKRRPSRLQKFWGTKNQKGLMFGYYWGALRGNSTSGFLKAIAQLYRDPNLWYSVKYFFSGDEHEKRLDNLTRIGRMAVWAFSPGPIGKLAYKEEPGKVRVFAMVDIWTQWILQSLHEYLFSRLRELPTDGTFDQGRAVRYLQNELRTCKCAYSFDLTAATDRLPIRLQSMILNYLKGELGNHWANLLVNRDYWTPDPDGQALRYAVGQPMGALSSWAMLAVTHHFIVQLAASRIYGITKGLFLKYVILGDDLVICDKGVAKEYLKIMKQLDAPINLSKSLISPKGYAEFAKRFVNSQHDLSGISLKEYSSLHFGLPNLIALVNRFKIRENVFNLLLNRGSKSAGHIPSIFTSTPYTRNWLDSLMYRLADPTNRILYFYPWKRAHLPYWGVPILRKYRDYVNMKKEKWGASISTSSWLGVENVKTSSAVDFLSTQEQLQLRSFVSYLLRPGINHFSVNLVQRNSFIHAHSLLESLIVGIIPQDSPFWCELVWGCSPKLRFGNLVPEKYWDKMILMSSNLTLSERMKVLMEDPKKLFSSAQDNNFSNPGIRHVVERIKVLPNQFNPYKVEDLSKWLYWFIKLWSAWQLRYPRLRLNAPLSDDTPPNPNQWKFISMVEDHFFEPDKGDWGRLKFR